MIIIDPGHGGGDPGGGTNDLWKEKDLAFQISNYQFDRFNELGIPTKLTRYEDEYLSPKERASRMNDAFGASSDVIGLSNHINKDATTADGAEVIYSIYDSPELANEIAASLNDAGQNIRGVYTRTNSLGNDYYFIIRDTRPIQTNLIEYGFADSQKDYVGQLYYGWKLLAESVVKAVSEYKGVEYIQPEFYTYEVRDGDSLFKLAQNYNTTVDELIDYNNLSTGELSVGQIIKIPTSPNMSDFYSYTVNKGDSLFKIADKFNTSISDIKSLNNLPNDVIQVGQVLKIPKKLLETSSIIYTVRPKDTLYSISNRYGVDVSTIKDVNNIDGETIYIGEELVIPLPVTLIEYEVKSGDSLWKISNQFNTTIDNLINYNNLTSTILNVGQSLLVPN